MEKNTKKQGEIKTWNEGKPNVVGSAGALGLIGGIAGRAVKLFSNTAKQYLRNNTTTLNMRSAVKQYLGKGAGKGYGKNTKVVDKLHNTPNHPLNPLSTPLTPKFTPKNPRGYDTSTWKGGRKVKRPGSADPYSAKDPIWPKSVDQAVYPRNWK